MNNHNLNWRIWANIVAVIDMIFVILQLMVFLLMMFLVSALFATTNGTEGIDPPLQYIEVNPLALWFSLTIVILQTGVTLWAAIQLYKATQLGRGLKDAYKGCKSWQIVCFVFIVLNIVSCSMVGTYCWTATVVLVRIMLMGIVFGFMREVHAVVNTTPQPITQQV